MTRLPLVILHVDRENLTALGSEGTFSRRPGRAPHLQPMCSFPLNRGEQCDPLQKQTPSLRASVERAPALQDLARPAKFGQCDYVASTNILRSINVRQIERSARTRYAKLNITIVRLDVSNPGNIAGWLDRNTLAASQSAAGQSSRDHRADAPQRENPVNRQSRFANITRRGCAGQNVFERRFQILEASSGNNRCGNNRRVSEGRVA